MDGWKEDLVGGRAATSVNLPRDILAHVGRWFYRRDATRNRGLIVRRGMAKLPKNLVVLCGMMTCCSLYIISHVTPSPMESTPIKTVRGMSRANVSCVGRGLSQLCSS